METKIVKKYNNIGFLESNYNIKVQEIDLEKEDCKQWHQNINDKWYHELDYIKFIELDTNYLCEIKRIPNSGHLCGYVYVPYKHYLNLFNTKSLDWIQKLDMYSCDDVIKELNIHGGITYDNKCEKGIYQILGFGTAYCNDITPLLDKQRKKNNEDYFGHGDYSYKNIKYVLDQLINLVYQIKGYQS